MTIQDHKQRLGTIIAKRRAELAITEYKIRKAAGKDGKLAAADLVPGIEQATASYTIDKLLAILEPLGGTLHIKWSTPRANNALTIVRARHRRPRDARASP